MKRAMIFIGLLIAAGIAVERYGTPGHLAGAAMPAEPPRPAPQVELDKFSGTKDGLLFVGTFTFANKGTVDVKDIRVTCTHYGPSGTAIDHNSRTIYEIVRANSSKTVRGFNMGIVHSQAVSSSCAVTDYVAL